MKVTYRFDRSFGPVASFAGFVILVAGVIATAYSFTGLILVVLGAFVGLTNTSTTIDYEKKRLRYTNNIFGIIRMGKWLEITEGMHVGIKQSNAVYRAYSRSNRAIDVPEKNHKIYLYDIKGLPILPLKQIKTMEGLKSELEEINNRLFNQPDKP